MKVAQKFKDSKVKFAIAEAAEFQNELDEFGIKYNNKPVVGAWDKKQQKFVMEGDFR